MSKVAIVVAHCAVSRAIGKQGHLPWGRSFTKDIAFFKKLTSTTQDPFKQNAVIMGRKTWDDIGRILTSRVSVVLSRTSTAGDSNTLRFRTDLAAAVEELKLDPNIERIIIIGGQQIYALALALDLVQEVFVTAIHKVYPNCDAFFPELRPAFQLEYSCREQEEDGTVLDFQRFVKGHEEHEEHQYLRLVKEILTSGALKGDRTGTGTKSVFGRTMRFSLCNGVLPLLTTKRTFWRGVAVELLWFISGKTNAATLKEQGVNIWEGNSSRKYLDSIGLTHREEGDLGPVYGFQWRHFGAEYKTMHDNYDGQGVDQLLELIETIKRDPNSRRLVLNAWNPPQLKDMALPPCHVMSQFYVSAEGELSCQMYQRSADMGLGVPFNIASYALLTRLIAQCCNLRCGELIHVIGDCHVYLNHEEALWEQLKNDPTPFPTLKITSSTTDIDQFRFEDLELLDYNPHKAIKMSMSV
jgi:dihydrofolate reductase/thymidylate synthase